MMDVCVTAHTTHPLASLLLSESYLQEHTVHDFYCCPSGAVCCICPVVSLSFALTLYKQAIKNIGLKWRTEMDSSFSEADAAVQDMQPYAV